MSFFSFLYKFLNPLNALTTLSETVSIYFSNQLMDSFYCTKFSPAFILTLKGIPLFINLLYEIEEQNLIVLQVCNVM